LYIYGQLITTTDFVIVTLLLLFTNKSFEKGNGRYGKVKIISTGFVGHGMFAAVRPRTGVFQLPA
jgi:hypothetical protein